MPTIYFGTQVVAAPFYPGYSFSQQSESMLDTHFSRHPGIFNVGLMLAGFAALGGALGLYRSFRAKTHYSAQFADWSFGRVHGCPVSKVGHVSDARSSP
jgi:hypothetical membrane protein